MCQFSPAHTSDQYCSGQFVRGEPTDGVRGNYREFDMDTGAWLRKKVARFGALLSGPQGRGSLEQHSIRPDSSLRNAALTKARLERAARYEDWRPGQGKCYCRSSSY